MTDPRGGEANIVSVDPMAMDLVYEHALSAYFPGTEHTVRHCREGWQPRLVDRQNYEQWEESGGTPMRDRARTKIDEILAEDQNRVLAPDVEPSLPPRSGARWCTS